MPFSAAVCGDDCPLSVIDNVPVRAPICVGVKVTLKVQVALTASVDGPMGQLLVCAKSPLIAMLEMVRIPGPVLVSVIDWLAVVWPRAVVPKVRLPGTSVTTPPNPVPVMLAD